MKKCEKCGKEVPFPFSCTYCGKAYCEEHRLPETHDCANRPREPPPFISPTAPENHAHRIGLCPKCRSVRSNVTSYDAESMTFKCKDCGFRYSQLKASPHDYLEPRDETKFVRALEKRKSFPIKRIVGGLLAVSMIFALLWYAPAIVNNFLSSTQQPKHEREDFQLPASYLFTPINVSGNIELRSGQTLVGNFTISNLTYPDSLAFFLSVVVLDPQERILALYTSQTETFSITATSTGVHVISFACTTVDTSKLPRILSVTLAYDISG